LPHARHTTTWNTPSRAPTTKGVYPYPAPLLVLVGIPALALLVAATFVAAHHRAAVLAGVGRDGARRRAALAALGIATWAAAIGAVAATGVLARADLRPPPMAAMFVLAIGSGLVFALSSAGEALARHLPLAALIGVQGFRLPLELVMHEAGRAGVMPVQLSFSGYNFDIVTGAAAIIVAILVARRAAPRALVIAWNLYGIAMLMVIAGIAIATAPFVRAFGEDSINTWVCYVPFVWLPTVLVPMAVAGHVIILRRLRADVA